MSFFPWLLRNRLLVVLLALLVVAAGVVAWLRLPIDAFPDVTNPQVMVLTEAPGLAAVDVELRVSYPIEQVMRGLPRVTQVRSISKAELSQVVIVFEDGTDTYWSRQIVFERLSLAAHDLPAGLTPELGPISTGLGEILQYTLEGEGVDPMELRSLQDWLVAPMLRPVPGVNEVNSFGGSVRQVQVLVRPESLLKYGLSSQDVVSALERSNGNAAGGVIVRGWEQVYLRGVGLLGDVGDVEEVVVRAADGTPVRVKDVADLVIGAQPRQGAVTRDGKGEVVAGMIIMLKGENSAEVVSRVKEAMEKVRGTLPPGVRLSLFYDRTSLIEACVDTVLDALWEGGIFVVLILFLFLAELRTALLVVLSIPLTFLATFILMRVMGLTSNLMSLGGLAFSVGMVVDASIVVVENVRRHFVPGPKREGRLAVAVTALLEVARPVAFSVLVVAIILVPLFTLQGIEGKMFAPMALTMLVALLVSLAIALTVVPVLSEWILAVGPEREFGFVRKFRSGYATLLQSCVRRPGWTLTVSGLALVGAAALVPGIGTEFMPPLDEGAIAVNVVRLPNASLKGSVQVADFMEKRLLEFPEVETVVSKTGRAEISEDPMGPEQTDVMILLKPPGEWKTGRSKAQLVSDMAEVLTEIPGLRFSFSQPIALRVNELISGVKSDLAVKIFGTDLDSLKTYADEAALAMASVEGAQDLKVEQVSGMTQLDVVINSGAASRHGIEVEAINDAIETAVAGRVATDLVEEQRRIAVVVRFPESARKDVAQVRRLLIRAPGGKTVPLEQLADFQELEAPAQVSRENGMRRVVVEANVRGRDLGGFVAEVKAALEPLERTLPPGYFIDYGGQFENQQRAMRQLGLVVPMALVLILVLLFSALGSVRNALLVLLNLPFGLIGGIAAVALFGMHLSVSAAVAFVILLAVAVQNGVVLVAFFQQLRREGKSVQETVVQGSVTRFRPLMMTALTSFIGHLPMLYATGSGADIQKPLAVVVMGGLVTSALLTLLVLPTVYALLERKRAA